MVSGERAPVGSADYESLYDKYWSDEDRIGESSGDLAETADQIVLSCGVGRTLDIGSGEGKLVAALLRRGVDAYGVDISPVVVSRCNERIPQRFEQGSVLALPFGDESFQSIVSTDCMEHLAPTDVPLALREMWRVAGRYVFLKLATTPDRDGHWHLTVEGRAWWERVCFEAGFRKHPAYYKINAYESLNQDDWQIIVPLEKIPAIALSEYPLASLKAERDLHMDMLREHGSRSDAHVARYELASRYVRPGDVVLDAACGLGYGSHVLRSLTKSADITGIDGSDFGIDYATKNFALDESIRFQVGYLPDWLGQLQDSSVDCIVCFETLEHVDKPLSLLSEFNRILTPGGRLIASVPHDWSDETGEDPNPFHLHVYTFGKFVAELSQSFDLEHLIGQTADRIKNPETCEWLSRPRSIQHLDPNCNGEGVEAEWLLSVACKSPLTGQAIPYVERVFTPGQQAASGNALAFARDYSNPWLVRSMISIGLRTENPGLRRQWATAVLSSAAPRSADYGAALCILAYEQLATGVSPPWRDIDGLVDSYVSIPSPENPNVLRWQVSLNHVRGLMALECGQRESAKQHFKRVIESPVASYSPTLLTKPMDAAYMLGVLHAADGELRQAQSVWLESFRRMLADLSGRLVSGYPEVPPGFELREVAAAIAVAGRLAVAAGHVEILARSPSVFYGEVNGDVVARLPWLVSQRDAWERLARSNGAQMAELASRLDELHVGNDWLLSQRDAWESVAADRESAIEQLTQSVQELQAGSSWLLSQRDAWQKLSGEKELALAATAQDLQRELASLNVEVQGLRLANAEFQAQDQAKLMALTSHKELVAALQTQLDGARAVNAALATEKNVWERLASEREMAVGTQSGRIQDLDALLDASDARLRRVRSHWAVRLLRWFRIDVGDV